MAAAAHAAARPLPLAEPPSATLPTSGSPAHAKPAHSHVPPGLLLEAVAMTPQERSPTLGPRGAAASPSCGPIAQTPGLLLSLSVPDGGLHEASPGLVHDLLYSQSRHKKAASAGLSGWDEDGADEPAHPLHAPAQAKGTGRTHKQPTSQSGWTHKGAPVVPALNVQPGSAASPMSLDAEEGEDSYRQEPSLLVTAHLAPARRGASTLRVVFSMLPAPR